MGSIEFGSQTREKGKGPQIRNINMMMRRVVGFYVGEREKRVASPTTVFMVSLYIIIAIHPHSSSFELGLSPSIINSMMMLIKSPLKSFLMAH